MSLPADKVERVVAAFAELSEAASDLVEPGSPHNPHVGLLTTDISRAWAFFRVYIHPFASAPEKETADEA